MAIFPGINFWHSGTLRILQNIKENPAGLTFQLYYCKWEQAPVDVSGGTLEHSEERICSTASHGKGCSREAPFPGTWPFLREGRVGRGASSSAHGVTGSTAWVTGQSSARCWGQGCAVAASSQWLSRGHKGKQGPRGCLGAGVLSCWWLALPCHQSWRVHWAEHHHHAESFQ